jgi:DNA-binding FadR family transcriptional regulator
LWRRLSFRRKRIPGNCDDLRAQIAQGALSIGSRLPPERNIAETYGVSRTIVREALLMLELQGTVDIRQGSGVYVMRIPHERQRRRAAAQQRRRPV